MLICHIWYTSVIMFIWTVRKVQKWKKKKKVKGASQLPFFPPLFLLSRFESMILENSVGGSSASRNRPSQGCGCSSTLPGKLKMRWDVISEVDRLIRLIPIKWNYRWHETMRKHDETMGRTSPNTKSRTRCGNDSIWSSERIGLRDSEPGNLTLHSQPQSDDDNHSCLCFPSEEHGQFQSVIPPTIGPLA